MPTQKITDEQIITALIAAGGVYAHAAQKLGIGHTTLRRRVETKQALIDARDEGKQLVLDAAETALFKAVREGKAWAVKYILSRLGRGRGYGAKLELEGSNALGRVVVYLPDDGREGKNDTGGNGVGDQTASGATDSGAAEPS